MISIVFIVAYILLAIFVISSAYIVFGYGYGYNYTDSDSDYCSMFDDGYVEYCLIFPKILSCDEPMEQMLCKELAEGLEKQQ